MMAAAAAAGSASGGGSSGGGGGGSSSSDTSSTGEEERMRRLFQTCDGDGDGYISRYWGGTRNRLGRNQPLRAALEPSPARSPQLPASCSEARGKSWLRLRERVAGSATKAEGLICSPPRGASWSNFSQRCLCLGVRRHLFRMRVLPGSWSVRACAESSSGPLSQGGGAALQPLAPGVKLLWQHQSGCSADSPETEPGEGCAVSDRVGHENRLRRTLGSCRAPVFQTAEPTEWT